MTQNILLTRFQGGKNNAYLPGMGSRRTRTVDAMGRQRREGWLQHCPLSYDQARWFTHLLLNVMRSKRFLSHLILTLSWCLKYKISSWWKKLASSYNPFPSSKSPFEPLLGSTTCFSPWNGGKNVVYDVTNFEQHELLGFTMRAIHSPTWSQNGQTRS